MDVYSYGYVNKAEITGNMAEDTAAFLLANNKKNTLKHVTEVADTNKKIAEKYGLDQMVCSISGYLHDISAVIKPVDMLAYMKENHLYIDESERKYPFILHQRISRLLAENHFHIDNEKILSAIECHTTLKSNPSQYDMALFIADKLSWDQEGTPPYYDIVLRNLSESLEKASLAYINYIIDHEMILLPHKWLQEAKKSLERK